MSDSIGHDSVLTGERKFYLFIFHSSSFRPKAVSDWVKKQQYHSPLSKDGSLPVILTTQKLLNLQAPQTVAVNAGFGIFEVGLIHLESSVHEKTRTLWQIEGAFDGSNPTLFKNGSLFIVTPGYPRFQIAGGLTGDLSKNKITSTVKSGKFANGKIEIFLADKDKKTVGIAWNVDVQFAGQLEDQTYFFDVEKYVS